MEAACNINDSALELTESMADLLQRQAELGAGVLLEVDECGNVIAKVLPLNDTD